MELLSSIEIKLLLNNPDDVFKIAFLPVGCVEQHGPFMPITTDSIIAEAIVEDLNARLNKRNGFWCYSFPGISYTPTKSNINYSGTVSVNESSFRLYLNDVVSSILSSDFNALIIISGHGPADNSIKEIEFNIVQQQFISKVDKVKPILSISLARETDIFVNEFNIKSGKHADWREFILLYKILGNSYFTDSKLNEMKHFDLKNSNQFDVLSISGIPMEYRSNEGVIGVSLPFDGNPKDYELSSEKAWVLLTEKIEISIINGLKDFINIIKMNSLG